MWPRVRNKEAGKQTHRDRFGYIFIVFVVASFNFFAENVLASPPTVNQAASPPQTVAASKAAVGSPVM